MNIKSIISRFLPLLDVTVVLLGLMIVLMTYAHFEKKTEKTDDLPKGENTRETTGETPSPETSLAAFAKHVDILLLHADPDGKCYLLGENNTKQREPVDTENDSGIRKILDGKDSKKMKLLILFSRPDEVDSAWPWTRVDKVEKTWNLKENEKFWRLTSVPF